MDRDEVRRREIGIATGDVADVVNAVWLTTAFQAAVSPDEPVADPAKRPCVVVA